MNCPESCRLRGTIYWYCYSATKQPWLFSNRATVHTKPTAPRCLFHVQINLNTFEALGELGLPHDELLNATSGAEAEHGPIMLFVEVGKV